MIRRPPRSTLFPYTTLFRSCVEDVVRLAPEVLKEYLQILPAGVHDLRDFCIRHQVEQRLDIDREWIDQGDRKSTRLNSSHANISYAVFCLKQKKQEHYTRHR